MIFGDDIKKSQDATTPKKSIAPVPLEEKSRFSFFRMGFYSFFETKSFTIAIVFLDWNVIG